MNQKEDVFNRCLIGDGCWEWTGGTTSYGYGVMSFQNHTVGAHRLAWEAWHEQLVPAGLYVLHHCDNPPCIRPDHLYVGTPSENMFDKVAKGRHPGRAKTHCKWGHSFEDHAWIDKNGRRCCRICLNRRQQAYRGKVNINA